MLHTICRYKDNILSNLTCIKEHKKVVDSSNEAIKDQLVLFSNSKHFSQTLSKGQKEDAFVNIS